MMSLLPRQHSQLTKWKTNKQFPTSGLPAYFLFPPSFPECCLIPKLSGIHASATLSRTYKPNAQGQTVYPKPKRVSEDKPMPESSPHIQSHKQVHSRKISEQTKDHVSMASSTISNTFSLTRFVGISPELSSPLPQQSQAHPPNNSLFPIFLLFTNHFCLIYQLFLLSIVYYNNFALMQA